MVGYQYLMPTASFIANEVQIFIWLVCYVVYIDTDA